MAPVSDKTRCFCMLTLSPDQTLSLRSQTRDRFSVSTLIIPDEETLPKSACTQCCKTSLFISYTDRRKTVFPRSGSAPLCFYLSSSSSVNGNQKVPMQRVGRLWVRIQKRVSVPPSYSHTYCTTRATECFSYCRMLTCLCRANMGTLLPTSNSLRFLGLIL